MIINEHNVLFSNKNWSHIQQPIPEDNFVPIHTKSNFLAYQMPQSAQLMDLTELRHEMEPNLLH